MFRPAARAVLLSFAVVFGAWTGPAFAQAEQDSDANQDDTADIDTVSSVDTAEATRDLVLRGDFRPLINYADIDGRDGANASDTSAQARIRLKGSLGVTEGIQFGARIAGRCSTDDCSPEWVSDRAIPQSNGLANGQFTFDELYVHFFRREKFNLTVGRQQTRFILRGGVFSRSLDRNDSSNTTVTWTDGLHLTLRRREGWETHIILQHNAADGSGSVRREPLDFSTDSARTSYFVGTESTAQRGPFVQRSLGVTYLPNTLLVDGDISGRREHYTGLVGRLVARWPQRPDRPRLRAGVEIGYAPETPTPSGAGIEGDVDGLAWNVTASIMDFRPRHSIGVAYAHTGAGWLISPNYTPNEEAYEIRYVWRPRNLPTFDIRVRRREDIERAVDAVRKREVLDAFLRMTWQFDL